MLSEPFLRPVVVIGGGVVGLSVAREFALRGARRIIVLEKDAVGSLASGAATCASLGVLSAPTSAKSPLNRLQALGHRSYKDFAHSLLEETGIDIGYRVPGALHLETELPRPSTRGKLERSYHEAGVSCRWIDGKKLREVAPAISERFCVARYLPDEAVVHPPKLVHALKASCEKLGVEVREGIGRVKVLGSDDPRAELESGEVFSGAVMILTAGAWSSGVLGEELSVRPQVEPIRGQAMEVRFAGATCPNLHFRPESLDKDYHLVPKGNGAAWIGATVEEAGFEARVTPEGIETLFRVAREVLPELKDGDLVRAWAGLRPRAQRRGGPFLGKLPGARDVWVACGHYRGGILIGPVTARLLAAEIAGDEETFRAAGFDRETWAAFRPDR